MDLLDTVGHELLNQEEGFKTNLHKLKSNPLVLLPLDKVLVDRALLEHIELPLHDLGREGGSLGDHSCLLALEVLGVALLDKLQLLVLGLVVF